jgi:hypothetical protein
MRFIDYLIPAQEGFLLSIAHELGRLGALRGGYSVAGLTLSFTAPSGRQFRAELGNFKLLIGTDQLCELVVFSSFSSVESIARDIASSVLTLIQEAEVA